MTNHEVDPEVKRQIAEEGFEGEEAEGGAAVIIGPKEDMPELLEKLENEGRAESVGSYIRMHKEIRIPKEKISDLFTAALGREIDNLKPGTVWFLWQPRGEKRLTFIDKDKNIAGVKIDPEKIASIKDIEQDNDKIGQVRKELEELGFGEYSDWHLYDDVLAAIKRYNQALDDELGKEKRAGFDF